ncbi:hypothetical protein DFH06DRAFT_1476348 [Mycena polygramma]|nr:hypothetical protein DFH06DRAFT_1476348 [Mycena polygramma]
MQCPPLPPLPALQGLACPTCFKEDDIPLSRCSGCHRISYCSPECQKVDRKMHKPMCKALNAVEKSDPIAAAEFLSTLPSEPITDVQVLNHKTVEQISIILDFCRRSLQRPATYFETYLVVSEPRCLVCTRTEQVLRMEAAIMGATTDNSRRLLPCPQCNLSFCCSQAHWEAAHALHHGPCEDAVHRREGLSQCKLNSEMRAHIKFEALCTEGNTRDFKRFRWAPPRVKSAWTTLAGSSWESQIGDDIRTFFGIPVSVPLPPVIRSISDDLTVAMTILYGLEKLNDDDGWTRKHTLTLHVLTEINCGLVLEEILHRCPEVKVLKLVLCGPRLPRHAFFDSETCSACTQRGRKRIHEHAHETYQEFVANKGSRFEKPDLCIAFNSCASQDSKHTWPPTMKVLVERKIPTLFTSFTREEAEGEAALLRAAGARLHPDLGPGKNSWGSLNVRPGPMKLYGFCADSGWLADGFR